jgi:hypothetical protein
MSASLQELVDAFGPLLVSTASRISTRFANRRDPELAWGG